MGKPLMTMAVEVRDFTAVENFIRMLDVKELSAHELRLLTAVLHEKNDQVRMELKTREWSEE